MGNTAAGLKPLLLPAVVAALWLLSGLGYSVLVNDGRLPAAFTALVFPDTLPIRAQVLLDNSGRVLVAGLTALAVAAAALALLPAPGRTGATPRHTTFLAAWMAIALAAVAGSAVLGTGLVLADWPMARKAWVFDLISPVLLTGAYWGVVWGWLPALLASRTHDDDALPPERRMAPQRGWALGAFVLFSAAVLVALPLTARGDPSQPSPEPVATPAPEPTVYGAAPVGAALSEPDPLWCTGEEVEPSIGGWDAATGHRAAQITLRNTGTRSCTVQGYPDLDFESSDGWVMGITAVHGGSHMTQDAPVEPVTLAPGEEATASIGWRGTAGAGVVRVGTLLVAPYSGTQRQELEADIDLAEPGFLTVTAWAPAG
ncbi:DUF4232 domain-containing protein [Arthrobacter sp. zg-Y844]|uniref:DUF4232 domain-containing protein n=1 Tax=Arthrobacter sp. zg-Y844 TaxID=2964612 RepID=UPI002106CBAE|nr:DUF4232 domain-containing protein [Arthrobacter sp. zg-Y844]MCQ1986047.1 DUF4232 domain-containing protein [Arthrobacter sp. zg-Y844]